MTELVVAYDDDDLALGAFVKACQERIRAFLNGKSFNYSELNSRGLNDLSVALITENLQSFIFGAFSHGKRDQLLGAGNQSYVSILQNGNSFNNSFFYTFSCSSGENLGRDIIDYGCHCFIGYRKRVSFWSTYILPFVDCATFGLIYFLEGHETESVYSAMMEQYNSKIDDLYRSDYLVASILRENRDALVLHGKNISLNDL